MTDDEIGTEAMHIANEIQRVLANRSSAAGLLAIGMVLGYADTVGERSDMDGLMRRVRRVADAEANRIRQEQAH